MALERLLWSSEKGAFVKSNQRDFVVLNPRAIGFPVTLFVCTKEIHGTSDEENINNKAPEGANAYCSGNLLMDRKNPGRLSFGVQYYQI